MDEPCESQQQVVWMLQVESEMQKVAVAADISVLFFSAGANFWAILGHFWANLGNFGPFFGANFLWQNMPLCYWNHFLQLWDDQLLQKLSSVIFHLCLNIFRHPSRKWNHSLKTSNQFRLKLLFLLWADSSKRLGPAPPHSWLSHCGASLVLAIILRPTHVITKKKSSFASPKTTHTVLCSYTVDQKGFWTKMQPVTSTPVSVASWQAAGANHKSCIGYKSKTADTLTLWVIYLKYNSQNQKSMYVPW